MKLRGPLSVPIALVLCTVTALGGDIDHALAKQYFAEAHRLCTADAGALWGTSLCGPMMFTDPQTHDVVASEADAEGQLKADGGVFVGKLPTNVNLANTSIEWAGVLWTQVMWPLPTDAAERRVLLAHESFHRLQSTLPKRTPTGSGTGDSVDSLDTAIGRYLVQMEWRALARALGAVPESRREFVTDALVFRARRRELFPADREREQQQESNEGLAEYTGAKLGGAGYRQQIELANADLAAASEKPSFVRSFAYGSGPAYGLLLDACLADWRKNELTEYQDVGRLLQRVMTIELPIDLELAAKQRMGKYDGAALEASELSREKARAERLAAYRSLLVDGPVLHIPLQQIQISFNPNNLQPITGLGTAYPNLHISDVWGVLEVSKGALLSSDWQQVTISAPKSPVKPGVGPATLEGDGWTLKLKPGWKIETAKRAGDFEVTKSRDSLVGK